MEILFENTFVRTKEIIKETYSYLFFKRPVVLIAYALMALIFLFCLWEGVIYGWYNTFVLVFVPVYFALRIWSYHRNVNTMAKRDLEQFGSEITVTNTVTEQYLQCKSLNGFDIKLEYDHIKKAHMTKNLIILHSKANLLYIFHKAFFTVGTADEFVEFLKGKEIKIK